MGRTALGFLIGSALVHLAPRLPWHAADAWLTAVSAGVVALAAVRWRCWWLLALVAGGLWAWVNAGALLARQLPAALEGEDLQLQGYIASLPQGKEVDRQLIFEVREGSPALRGKVRLTWYRAPQQPATGELWQLTVRLKRRNGFVNPGGFDYEGHLFRQGIIAVGYVREHPQNMRLEPAGWRYAVTRARGWVAHKMADAVGEHPMLGVLQGLAVGDTHAMTREQWDVFGATGTTHLMAISGLHVSMVAMLMAWCGGGIARWSRAQMLGITAMHGRVAAGMAAAIGYALMAGLSIPTQRTLVMLCIYFSALWQRRSLDFSRAFSLAVIAVLLVDPFAPLAPGAWLSFGAVAVIVAAVGGRLGRQSIVGNFCRVQMAVSVGLVPVLAVFFGNVPLLSPVANALAIPLFSLLVVPAVLLGAALAACSVTVGGWVLTLAAQVLQGCWPIFQWLAHLPMAVWFFPQMPWVLLPLLVVAVGLLVIPGRGPLRLAGWLLGGAVALYRPAPISGGQFEATVLDVGQGLAVVVRTRSHALLYDTGPAFFSGSDAAQLAVLPALRSQGVRELDVLMVSHGDQDHAGGLQTVLDAIRVQRLLAGPSVTQASVSPHECRRGQRWRWDGVDFQVLHPDGAEYRRRNDSSCVLLIRGDEGSLLLTGDIESRGESALLSQSLSSVQVVVAPHHGSRTSSGPALVAATQPEVVIFPTGYRNRWRLPNDEVVQRWQASGARTLSTEHSGAIRLVWRDGQLQAQALREQRPRYWRRTHCGQNESC